MCGRERHSLANFFRRCIYILRCRFVTLLILRVRLPPNRIRSTELDIGVCKIITDPGIN